MNNLFRACFTFLVVLLLPYPDSLSAQSGDTAYIEIVGSPVINTIGSELSELSDTITLQFNLYKNWDTESQKRILSLSENDSIIIDVAEYIGDKEDVFPIEYITNSLKKLKRGNIQGTIPSDITISLLVDRSGSISEDEMGKIKNAIQAFVAVVPDSCLYFSWFHDDVSESMLLTKENFQEAELITSKKNTALYNAIYTKILEFDAASIIPNDNPGLEPAYKRNTELAARKSSNNYLIVLTDGVNDVSNISKYQDPEMEVINFRKLYKALKKYKSQVKVFTLGFGESSEDFDEVELKNICQASGNPEGYFLAKPDDILELFKVKITDRLSPDYELMLRNKKGKKYQGNKRTMKLLLQSDNAYIRYASGKVEYSRGSTSNPFTVGKDSIWVKMPGGLIVGIVLWLVIMIIVQLIIPLFRNRIFSIRYVKKYKPAENELRKECTYCGDPLNAGDRVVVKCKHVVHKACWHDFDHVCPEYGQNCNEGKQEYFDISDPFSRKNRKYYVKWILYGLAGGFISWFLFMIFKDTESLYRFTIGLVEIISPEIDQNSLGLFAAKISPLLIIGNTMGFFLTLFFSYIEDYRRKSLRVVGSILLRSLIGGIIGFIAFLIGGIILILLDKPYTSVFFDWIPWILFGVSIGLLLSIKTTIVWKHGVLGGVISIVFSFFILYTLSSDFNYNAILVSFMIFGGGLGVSIATVHSRAEHYYLKILQGKKNVETIPIHKWMSYQGGHNEVYIGTAFSCEIQMNWETNNTDIAEKHAKLFLNASNIPVIVSIEKGKTTIYNDRFEMNIGKEYELYSGATFKIGETVFQYFEKEKSSS